MWGDEPFVGVDPPPSLNLDMCTDNVTIACRKDHLALCCRAVVASIVTQRLEFLRVDVR